jgi:hypothetical protein
MTVTILTGYGGEFLGAFTGWRTALDSIAETHDGLKNIRITQQNAVGAPVAVLAKDVMYKMQHLTVETAARRLDV